jgi:hypothetical protein
MSSGIHHTCRLSTQIVMKLDEFIEFYRVKSNTLDMLIAEINRRVQRQSFQNNPQEDLKKLSAELERERDDFTFLQLIDHRKQVHRFIASPKHCIDGMIDINSIQKSLDALAENAKRSKSLHNLYDNIRRNGKFHENPKNHLKELFEQTLKQKEKSYEDRKFLKFYEIVENICKYGALTGLKKSHLVPEIKKKVFRVENMFKNM